MPVDIYHYHAVIMVWLEMDRDKFILAVVEHMYEHDRSKDLKSLALHYYSVLHLTLM